MSDKAARRAALLAELAALDEDDDDPAELVDAVGDVVTEVAEAVADAVADATPDPAPVEFPDPPSPAEHAAAEVAVIEAETAAQIELLEAQARIDEERRDADHQRELDLVPDDAVPLDPLAALDEALGPIEVDVEPDATPADVHRWFKRIGGGRR